MSEDVGVENDLGNSRVEVFCDGQIAVYDVFPCHQNSNICLVGYYGRVDPNAVCHFSESGQNVAANHIKDPCLPDGGWNEPRVSLLFFPIPEEDRRAGHSFISITSASGSVIENKDFQWEPPSKNHYLAISTLFKDEVRFLKEWIEYHRLVGVEHFYLYDNNSQNRADIQKLLRPYIDQNIVTYVLWDYPYVVAPPYDWSWAYCQSAQLNHCLYCYGDENYFILNIDVDEFAYPVDTNCMSILPILKDYDRDDLAALRMKCMWFGNSSRRRVPPGFVIEKFFMRANHVQSHQHEKCFIKPGHIRILTDVHNVTHQREGMQVIDFPEDELRMNHYHATSAKKRIGDPSFNDIVDEGMHRFLPRLKTMVG